MQTTPEKPSKPTMVFLPGKLCDMRIWEKQILALEHVIKPIFVDLRYYDDLEKMLNAILDLQLEPFILVGFSMGGYVAQEFALKYPEKLKGLVLVGSSARGYSEAEKKNYQVLIDYIIKGKTTVINKSSILSSIHPSRHQDQELITLIEDMLVNSGDKVFLNQQTATLNRVERFNDLHKISGSALVIGGVDDQIANILDIELTAKSIPNAEFYSFKLCGHMITLEYPDELTSILQNWVITQFELVN